MRSDGRFHAPDLIASHVRHEVGHLKLLIEEKLAGAERALRLQAREYERRLELLNGEQKRIAEMRNVFVPREVYEKEMERLRVEAVESRKVAELTRARQEESAAVNRRNTLLGWLAAGMAVFGWA